jgi:hypothetical protein
MRYKDGGRAQKWDSLTTFEIISAYILLQIKLKWYISLDG